MWFGGMDFRNILSSPDDGSEIRLKTTWDVEILVNNGINYQPQLVSLPDFCTINSTSLRFLVFSTLESYRSDWMSKVREELLSCRQNTLSTKGFVARDYLVVSIRFKMIVLMEEIR